MEGRVKEGGVCVYGIAKRIYEFNSECVLPRRVAFERP